MLAATIRFTSDWGNNSAAGSYPESPGRQLSGNKKGPHTWTSGLG